MEPDSVEPASAPVFRYADPERNAIEVVETGGVFPAAEAKAYRCGAGDVLPYDAEAAKSRRRQQALALLGRLDQSGLRSIRAVLTAMAGGKIPSAADVKALRDIEAAAAEVRKEL